MLPETPVDEAAAVAEKLRLLVLKKHFDAGVAGEIAVSVSIGVAGGQGLHLRVDQLLRDAGPIIVNHEIFDWIRHSRDEEVHMPGLPVENTIDPHAKDLTGYILTWQE